MNRNIVVAVILGLLVLVSVVQAFQLNSLKEKVKSGDVVAVSGSAASSVSLQSGQGGSPALPSNLQSLPDMVGGC